MSSAEESESGVERGAEDLDYEEAGKYDKNESYGEEAVPKQELSKDIIAECISMPYRLGYGFSHAFVKLDCSDRRLDNINVLREYIHLRFVILSNNYIQDISPVSVIGHLIYLKADNNQIQDAQCLNALKYLQFLDLSGNKLTSINQLNFQLLQHLRVNENVIESLLGYGYGLQSNQLPTIHTLELRGNRLTSLNGVGGLSSLKSLYCAENNLTQTEGIGGLTNLVRLHMRDNQLKLLPDFSPAMASLEYINLRGNRISRFRTVRALACLPSLKVLSLLDNPICDKPDYRLMVIGIIKPLQRLDKQRVTDAERAEGNAMAMQRQDEVEDESGAEAMEENLTPKAQNEEMVEEGPQVVEEHASSASSGVQEEDSR